MNAHAGSRCRELLERLSRYVDGDLSAGQERRLVTHLRKCPCCDQLVESLRRTAAVCREAGRTRLPPAVRARARARIAELMAEGKG